MPVPNFPQRKKEKIILAVLLLIVLVIYIAAAPIIGHAAGNDYGGGPRGRGHHAYSCPTNAQIYRIDDAKNAYRYGWSNRAKLLQAAKNVNYGRTRKLVFAAARARTDNQKVRLLHLAVQEAVKCHH